MNGRGLRGLVAGVLFLLGTGGGARGQTLNPDPPAATVKLVFVHHSTGENWLRDDYGGLGAALGLSNYFVSDTTYGWGPNAIGDATDIPNWLDWFDSADTPAIMAALFAESATHADYARSLTDPGGQNEIVMFKSCFPNSDLAGSPDDPPSADGWLTVGHAKYVYNRILRYFAAHPEKLFVVITAPPLTDATNAANARAFNLWLVNDWLAENLYPLRNVAVFDFYNVLTGPDHHHRYSAGAIQHVFTPGQDTSYYPSAPGGADDHPSAVGSQKATGEYVPLLNVFYHRWQESLAGVPRIGGCELFPVNNIWNTRVDGLPVHPRSADWVASIGAGTGFHMDFGSGLWDGGAIGIPYNLADDATPTYAVSFTYAGESDAGPYPIPASPLVEHGSDHHLLVVDTAACRLYEIYDAASAAGVWSGGSGATWDLGSNVLRPAGWTSADAAGLPLLPGLARYDEIAAGEINHALRFTAASTNGYLWPARHLTADDPGAPQIPPMGARFRLKAAVDISGYPATMQVLLLAMKTYGIILADNGSDWYVGGVPDERWDNDALHLLDALTGSDFEAVDAALLMADPDSAAAGPGTAPPRSVPVLVAPADGAALANNRVGFDWQDFAGATGYGLQVSRNAGFTSLVLNVNLPAVSGYAPPASLPAGSVLHWRVRAFSAEGPTSWSEAFTFTTARPPGVPLLLLPAQNALTTDSTPRLDWSAVSVPAGTSFDHYQVQVDGDADFSSPAADEDVPGLGSHELSPGADLDPNTRYRWRVRSWNAAGQYSDWSLVRAFRTALPRPSAIAPAAGARLTSRRPEFDWEDVAGATGYTVQVSRYPSFALPVTYQVPTPVSRYAAPADLPANVTFSWRVRALGPNGPSLFSEPRTFVTANPPGIPTLLSPAVNALVHSPTPRLDWGAVTLPAGTTFDHYELQADRDAGFTSPVVQEDIAGLASHEHTVAAALDPNTRYCWRVRSWNGAGEHSAWSRVSWFRSAMLPPALAAPAAGADTLTRRPEFSWDPVDGATGYTLQVARNGLFTLPVGTFAVATPVTRFVPPVDLPANSTLHWRVRATGPNGPSLFSGERPFDTGNPPGIPLLLAPARNALVTDATPRLDWSAASVPAGTSFDRYTVQVDDDPAFGSPEVQQDVGGLSSHEHTVATDLGANTRYFWRVRSWNAAGEFSGWSVVSTFRSALVPPVPAFPAGGETVGGPRPAFDWDDTAGAAGYAVQVSRTSAFTLLVSSATIGTPTSTWTPGANLPPGSTLYWRVRATGANGPSAWSGVESFRTP
jgi:hypothetical protein